MIRQAAAHHITPRRTARHCTLCPSGRGPCLVYAIQPKPAPPSKSPRPCNLLCPVKGNRGWWVGALACVYPFSRCLFCKVEVSSALVRELEYKWRLRPGLVPRPGRPCQRSRNISSAYAPGSSNPDCIVLFSISTHLFCYLLRVCNSVFMRL